MVACALLGDLLPSCVVFVEGCSFRQVTVMGLGWVLSVLYQMEFPADPAR